MLWIRGWGAGGRGRCLRFEMGGVGGAGRSVVRGIGSRMVGAVGRGGGGRRRRIAEI